MFLILMEFNSLIFRTNDWVGEVFYKLWVVIVTTWNKVEAEYVFHLFKTKYTLLFSIKSILDGGRI